jgi:hypothetical protein
LGALQPQPTSSNAPKSTHGRQHIHATTYQGARMRGRADALAGHSTVSSEIRWLCTQAQSAAAPRQRLTAASTSIT